MSLWKSEVESTIALRVSLARANFVCFIDGTAVETVTDTLRTLLFYEVFRMPMGRLLGTGQSQQQNNGLYGQTACLKKVCLTMLSNPQAHKVV